MASCYYGAKTCPGSSGQSKDKSLARLAHTEIQCTQSLQ